MLFVLQEKIVSSTDISKCSIQKETALVLSISTNLLACAYSTYFWWCIIFTYALLCYYIVHTQKEFLSTLFAQGLVWGVCVYGFHLYPMMLLAYTHAGFAGYVFLVFLWCYMALLAGIWFAVTHALMQIKIVSSIPYVLYSISLYAYIYLIDTSSFFIFGCYEGYGGLHPLVLCMQYVACRAIVWSIGLEFATFLFIVFSTLLVAAFLYASPRRYIYFITIVLITSVYISNYVAPKKNKDVPDWIAKIGTISLPLQSNCIDKQWDVAQQLYKKIDTYIRDNHRVELIIFPESTFCFELNRFPEMIQFLTEYICKDKGIKLILGCHRKEGPRLYNTLYYLSEEPLYTYDKTHGLLGAERVPHIAQWSNQNKSLLMQGVTFTQASVDQSLLKWQDRVFQPYICSELFFTSKRSSASILCIANDAWYVGTFLPQLLALTALFKSVVAQRELIYVAHEYSFYANKDRYVDLKNKKI